MLEKGVVVYDSESLSDRVTISDGIFCQIVKGHYCFLPVTPYRLLNQSERELIIVNQPDEYDYQYRISIIKLDQTLFQPLLEIGIHDIVTYQDYQKVKTHPMYESIFSYIDNIAKLYLLKHSTMQRLSFAWNRSELLTTTVKASTDIPLGLHLDYWDKHSLQTLYQARNRICINVGREERYFLFINLTLPHICNILRSNEIAYGDLNSAREKFLQNFSEYKVICVKIKPFEAYIAPTEWIIHDASSMNQQFCDLTITYLGHFDIADKSDRLVLSSEL